VRSIPVASNLPQVRFRTAWLCLGWVFVALALLACLAPVSAPGLSGLFVINDKVAHAAGYAALSLWFAGLYPRSRYVWIALALFAMGVIVELLQGWMSAGRNRDALDVIANTTGIVVGLSLSLTALGAWAQRAESLLTRRG
jgi:VanZ family protein